MRVSDFDFDLPEDRIALRPARPRDASRLLHVGGTGALGDHGMLDLPELLQPGDLLVLNDTRVIPAALNGERPARAMGGGGPARIEVNLHKRETANAWRAFARPGKRLKVGDTVDFGGLGATVDAKSDGGEVTLRFDQSVPIWTARLRVSVPCLYRPISLTSARRMRRMPKITRRHLHAKRVRSQRPRPVCILPTGCSQHSMRAASSGPMSRSMSGRGPSCR